MSHRTFGRLGFLLWFYFLMLLSFVFFQFDFCRPLQTEVILKIKSFGRENWLNSCASVNCCITMNYARMSGCVQWKLM